MAMLVKYGRPGVMIPGGSSIAIGSEELEWQSDEAATLSWLFHIYFKSSYAYAYMPIHEAAHSSVECFLMVASRSSE